MHVRRKFLEAEDAPVVFRQTILKMISNMYRYERVGKKITLEDRHRLRQQKVRPLVEGIFKCIEKEMTDRLILPKSAIGKAVNYTMKLKDALQTFLKNPLLEPDNGESERAIRPMTIGRRNWLFVGSKKGGDATALWVSLIQTARANDIDSFTYITETLRRINGHPANKIEELLPHNFKA